jgi:hypothetical protein
MDPPFSTYPQTRPGVFLQLSLVVADSDVGTRAEKVGLTRDLAPFNRFVHSCGVLLSSRPLPAQRGAGEVPQSPEKRAFG